MNSLKEHDVADLVLIERLPPGAKPIGSRWLCKMEDVYVRQAKGYEIMDQETGLPLIMKLKKSLTD